MIPSTARYPHHPPIRERPRRRAHRSATISFAVVAAAALALAACGDDSTDATPSTTTTSAVGNAAGQGNGPGDGFTVGPNGETTFDDDVLRAQIDAIAPGELTQDERDGLVFMREEEFLAGDVYQVLYDQWQLETFANIYDAEITHTNSVKILLDRYQIDDPAADHTPGVFVNETLQTAYDDLVALGRRSLVDALTAGATIEDLDIADLQLRATTTADIALVYANLERGSRNHLRAFVKQLDAQGATYTPAYISQDDFDAIIGSDVERG